MLSSYRYRLDSIPFNTTIAVGLPSNNNDTWWQAQFLRETNAIVALPLQSGTDAIKMVTTTLFALVMLEDTAERARVLTGGVSQLSALTSLSTRLLAASTLLSFNQVPRVTQALLDSVRILAEFRAASSQPTEGILSGEQQLTGA